MALAVAVATVAVTVAVAVVVAAAGCALTTNARRCSNKSLAKFPDAASMRTLSEGGERKL